MNKFANISREEQETIVNIDYFEKQVHCYTSRYSTYDRLVKKLGEPTTTYYIGKKISGAKWFIPFNEKQKLRAVFSRPNIIGSL